MTSGDHLLSHLVTRLQQDSRVAAAWLTGSRGRGTNDRLSDIDIWVAIKDDAIQELNANPRGFVEGMVPVLLYMLAPEIAPTGGSFMGSWVGWGEAFEQVDWYFTPASLANRGAASEMLFGDVPVQAGDLTVSMAVEDAGRVAVANLKLALQMINNMMKHTARANMWRAVEHARHADACLANAMWLRRHGRKPAFDEQTPSWLPDTLPGQPRDFARLALDLLLVIERHAAEIGTGLDDPCAAMRARINQLYPGTEDARR